MKQASDINNGGSVNLNVRHHMRYAELLIEEGRTTMETGFLDKSEAKELAKKLREAADELDPEGA